MQIRTRKEIIELGEEVARTALKMANEPDAPYSRKKAIVAEYVKNDKATREILNRGETEMNGAERDSVSKADRQRFFKHGIKNILN